MPLGVRNNFDSPLLHAIDVESSKLYSVYHADFFCLQMKQKYHEIADVKCVTVDKYQGEENDIILLSLVRSQRNKNAGIGFLDIENRVNVALSRAKQGLFIVGNMDHISRRSLLWRKIKKELEAQQAIGKY